MNSYALTPRAQADLDEIWDYTADTWDIEQANLYIHQLQAAIELVAQDPRRGRPYDKVRNGYRKYSVNAHMVIYRIGETGVEIIRILHQRMDIRRHL